jgi:SAM-dependent methyltransferase
MSREQWSCVYCGSNVRWRSIIHALSMELFGKSLAISDFPHRQDLSGIGLSDWEGYANRLSKKLDYTNTFYHKQPLLDITCIDDFQHSAYDFIISTDVFEHICPPISKAFENARQLLKPGGTMILSVPYVLGETREHFPGTCKFSVHQKGSQWVLMSETVDGQTKEYTDITFHGGPGTTVEFRLFGKDDLLKDCLNAGFGPVRIHDETIEEFGIRWIPYVAEQAPYRPLIYGLDTPPWALVNGDRGGPTGK